MAIRLAFPVLCVGLFYAWPWIQANLPMTITADMEQSIRRLLGVLLFFFSANAASYALRYYFWHGWVAGHAGTKVPKLLIDLSTFAIWAIAAVLMLAFVFDIEVSAFMTTSGILIAVVDFALRNMISDVFTGIALGVEQPFQMQDWIELDDGTLGRVLEMNWRATKVITKEDVVVVVPNSYLATHPFQNFNAPHPYWRDSFDIVLDYDVTRYQVERILLSAAHQVEITSTIPHPPDVRILDFSERGVKWQLRFWVPDHVRQMSVRYEIQHNVLRNLHYSGIRVPGNKVDYLDVTDAAAVRDENAEALNFLHGIGLFKNLLPEELDLIRERMEERLFLHGTTIVDQGEEGESLFLVKEGYLDVFIHNEASNETDVVVGHLVPGNFFGEMSLLTGAPRAASVRPAVDAVVFEIKKDHIRSLLQDRPEIVRVLSEVLAERQLLNDRTFKSYPGETQNREKERIAEGFFGRIQQFFGVGASITTISSMHDHKGAD